MREFEDASLDIRVAGQGFVRPPNGRDYYAEIREQTETEADVQPDISGIAVDVREESEAEADTADRQLFKDDGIDVPEEGQELSAEEITRMYAAHGGSSRQISPMERIEHREAQDLEEIQSWLGDINPNFDAFDPESPYCNNCGSCALAVYRRLEGDTTSCASAENIGYNEEMEAITGMEQVSMSPEEIERTLLEQGDGAHAIIGIDRAEGPGHWFNAACVDGRVVAIDGQTGEITDWPPDYGDVVNWEMSVKRK